MLEYEHVSKRLLHLVIELVPNMTQL